MQCSLLYVLSYVFFLIVKSIGTLLHTVSNGNIILSVYPKHEGNTGGKILQCSSVNTVKNNKSFCFLRYQSVFDTKAQKIFAM